MRALIDGDVIAYAYGSLTKRDSHKNPGFCPELSDGDPLPFAVCWGGVQRLIESIQTQTASDSVEIFLSSREFPTWRFAAATILPYKGNRKDKVKPHHWQAIRDNLPIHYPNVTIAEGIEADDAMSIKQYAELDAAALGHPGEGTVICTVDKDLKMVPGWHYTWAVGAKKEVPMWYQSKINGLKCFYKQLITGDDTDNVLGLYGCGPKSAVMDKIDNAETETEMAVLVYEEYRKRFGNYALQFINETGRLLWMQRTRDDIWSLPVWGLEDG